MSETQISPALVSAENYEKNVVTYTTGPFAAILLEHARPQPGERVLDVACGTGTVARQAAPFVGQTGAVVALDINPAMVEVGRTLPAPDGAVIEWREGSATALPLPTSSFDLVLCQAGLQFVPDRSTAVDEMYRVLKPGGRAAISVWSLMELNPVQTLVWGTIARYLNTTVDAINPAFSLGDVGKFRALLEGAGFADVTIVPRSYTIRQPRNPQLVANIFASCAEVLPSFAAMDQETRTALAKAVEAEIAPAQQKYIEGDEELYPSTAQIAVAYKLQ